MANQTIQSKDIYPILRKRYKEGEYAVMQEVSDAAGHSRSRSADYIVMNLWPSRGLYLEGFEVKVYRSDWLNELKNPKKAENIFKYCDFFWLLTGSEDIAKLEEVPANWGWMCIKGNKIFIKKEAPRLEPQPISRTFLAALLKRADDKKNWTLTSDIQNKIDESYKNGLNKGQTESQYQLTKFKELRDNVKRYEEITGLDLSRDTWGNNTQKIGEAVKFINDVGVEGIKKDLLRLEHLAQSTLDNISKSLQALKQCEPEAINTSKSL